MGSSYNPNKLSLLLCIFISCICNVGMWKVWNGFALQDGITPKKNFKREFSSPDKYTTWSKNRIESLSTWRSRETLCKCRLSITALINPDNTIQTCCQANVHTADGLAYVWTASPSVRLNSICKWLCQCICIRLKAKFVLLKELRYI